jgi:hemerythrin-like domain-containing protein
MSTVQVDSNQTDPGGPGSTPHPFAHVIDDGNEADGRPTGRGSSRSRRPKVVWLAPAAGTDAPQPAREGTAVDAITLLRDDHDKAKEMLKELEETTERAVKTREQLFTKLKTELTVHEAIEEEIFYPALKQHAEAKDIVLEAYEEHNVVDMVMGELEQTPFEDETWIAKFTVMKENLEHHIEEEEGEMFEQARDLFDKETLDQLGERMQARKAELQQAA